MYIFIKCSIRSNAFETLVSRATTWHTPKWSKLAGFKYFSKYNKSLEKHEVHQGDSYIYTGKIPSFKILSQKSHPSYNAYVSSKYFLLEYERALEVKTNKLL